MRNDGIERKLLERIGETLVVRKCELIDYLGHGTKNKKRVVDSSLRSLAAKKLITPVYASESTFAITQKGMQELRD